MKPKTTIINMMLHHITQTLAILLALLWFGWKGAVVAFLLAWSANTEEYAR